MRFQHQQRGCRDHRRATIAPASTSNSSVVSSVGGGSAAVPTASPRRTALMTRSTWFSASAAVASTVARSALPTVSRSCDATAGHAASRSLRCRSAQLQAARHTRNDQRADQPRAVAQPHRQVRDPGRYAVRVPPADRSTRKSDSTTRSVVSGGAACVMLDRVTRAPEQRSAPANRSDSGPRPWIRIDAHRVRLRSAAVTTPASISDATSSPASTSNRASQICQRRAGLQGPQQLCQRGRRSTRQAVAPEPRAVDPTPPARLPSGRSNTGIAGLRV